MLKARLVCICFLVATFSGCSDQLFPEYPEEFTTTEVDYAEIRLVTYNIHAGKGPNGEGNLAANINAFRELLQGESIICLQEVEPDKWDEIKSLLSDYPYRFFLPQCSTKFGTNKQGGNAILSKIPIAGFAEQLIQTDPGGDKWERRAQRVRIYIGNDRGYINLFHYHNTFNWHENDSHAEKVGFVKFLEFVASSQVSDNELNVITGDFNLSYDDCAQLINLTDLPHHTSFWVDHIFSNTAILHSGIYNTVGAQLSDHNAVWTVLCNLDCCETKSSSNRYSFQT
jgi:endonuclease/exonuclease/phosphatase family metal-dependent hydrolase